MIPDNAKEITADTQSSGRKMINLTKNEGVEYCGVYDGSEQVPSTFGSADKANNPERMEWRHNFTLDDGEQVQLYGFAQLNLTMRNATVGNRYGFYFIGKIDGQNRCRVFELPALTNTQRDAIKQPLKPNKDLPF